jgi:chloramphenicol-sensitive protein RarD
MWGLFPLYFVLLTQVGPVEVVAHRVIWSFVVCVVLLAVAGSAMGRDGLRRLSRRQIVGLAAAAGVLSVNWGVFVYAVASQQVVQSSLGYFTNPLVSVLLGVVVLKERLSRGQWVAVGIAALAVAVLSLEAAQAPWIALSLAISFGLYGLLKNRVGRGVAALPGMTVETAALLIPAAAVLVVVGMDRDGDRAWSAGTVLLLLGTGPLTAAALLVFAAAARRIRLSTLGLVQYVTPVMQLVVGILVLGERMSAGRWAGFALIWTALIVLSVTSFRGLRGRP